MGETFKCTIPHVTTLSMTRKQIKEKTAYSPHIQTHMALAFLPSNEIHTFVTSLLQQYTDNNAIEQFHAYFSNTWLAGSFPVELWNQYRLIRSCALTTQSSHGMRVSTELCGLLTRTFS